MYPEYVPILQIKKGELDALSHLQDSTMERIRPVFEVPILTDEAIRKSKTLGNSDAPYMAHVNAKADSVSRFSEKMEFYFDIRGWAPNATVESGEHLVSQFGRRLADREVALNPVVSYIFWDDPQYRNAILSLPVSPQSHFLIRLSGDALEDLDDREYFLERFENIVSSLQVDSSRVGVKIDVGDVTQTPPNEIQETVEKVLAALSQYDLECVSLAGSSMPVFSSDMVEEENSTAVHLRREYNAWQAIRMAYPSKRIAFGDYGVNNTSIDGFPNPNANGKIRYTTSGHFFIARGQSRLKGDGFAQFYRLSAMVMDSEYFVGDWFSWGDNRIAACRNIDSGPGNLTTWITNDTNHHIEFVVVEVSEFSRELSRGVAAPVGQSERE